MDFDELSFEFDDSFGDLELDLEVSFDTRYIKPPKTKKISEKALKYDRAADLAKAVNVSENERAFVVVNGSFYFGDFIEALIVEHSYYVKELTISTLSMCQNNVDSLHLLMEEKYVNKVNLIVSDYFYSHERRSLIPYLYQRLDINNRFQLAVAGTHCKMCLIETYCGKQIVMHGSANMRSSGNIEQFVIEESKDLYKFNYEYQRAILDHYQTIQKPIRHKKLWNLINKTKD
jgi:hypothetical protein